MMSIPYLKQPISFNKRNTHLFLQYGTYRRTSRKETEKRTVAECVNTQDLVTQVGKEQNKNLFKTKSTLKCKIII
jgi:hypothetical protein